MERTPERCRRSPWSARSVALFGTVVTAMLASQSDAQTVRIGTTPSCAACAIRLDTILITTDPTGQMAGPPVLSIARAPDGTLFAVDGSMLPAVFSRSGVFQQRIGRLGSGPGEIRAAWSLLVDPRGRLHVLDPVLNRHSVYEPTGRFLGSTPLPGGAASIGGAALLPGGNVVVNRAHTSELGAGFALQELDSTGRVTRFFDEGTYDATADWEGVRLVFARQSGEIWTARRFDHVIDLFSTARVKTRTITRDAEWVKPRAHGVQPSDGTFDRPPDANITAIWEDADGLWVVTSVPSRDWKPGPTLRDWRPGMPRNTSPRFDSMIELIDVAAARVIAATRVAGTFWGAVDIGHLARSAFDANDEPQIVVVRVQFHNPQ